MRLYSLRMFLRLAGRDMRGPSRARLVFSACLALGVAVIACVGGLAATLDNTLHHHAKNILGGDIEFSQAGAKLSPEALAFAAFSGKSSTIAETNAMAESGGRRAMVEVKSIDAGYPLYGRMRFNPDEYKRNYIFRRSDQNGQFGAAVEQRLLDEMGLKRGDVLTVGLLDVEIRAVLTQEPDRMGNGPLILGPRVMINANAFEKTGLENAGKPVTYRTRVRLPATIDLNRWYRELHEKFPSAPWVTRDYRNSVPGLVTLIERFNLFFTLTALTTLITAGIGIGNATTAYLRNRRHTMAVFASLGASPNQVRLIYSLQLALLTGRGIVAGILLGIAAQLLILNMMSEQLLLVVQGAIFVKPLLVAAAFGALTVIVFACLPLLAATGLRPALLFRSQARLGHFRPGIGAWLTIALAVCGIFAVAVWTTHDAAVTLLYGLCAGAILLGFLLLASLLRRFASRAAHATSRALSLRMALLSFGRPAAATGSIMAALGISMTLLAALALTGHSLKNFLTDILPERAPAYYLLDIPSDKLQTVQNQLMMSNRQSRFDAAPSLQGRITRIEGRDFEALANAPEASWAIRSPLTVSYSYAKPETGRLLEGDWWANDYTGPPLASIEASVARSLGLHLGDRFTLMVEGREINAEITSIREADWGSLAMNFHIVLSPKELRDRPHHWLGALYTGGATGAHAQDYFRYFISDITVVDVRAQIERITGILIEASQLVWLSASLTVIGAVLVCTSALFASMQQRLYDIVVLQLLGATRRRLKRIMRLEFLFIGLSVAFVALAAGAAIAFAVAHFLLKAPFALPAHLALGSLLLPVLLAYVIGMMVARRALNAHAPTLLRND